MRAMTRVQTRWITFQTELFARKTLCNIVLDLCTQRTQTQTDMARVLFSPGGISVSEMKRTANISCLLHCRYCAVSAGADAWAAVRGYKKNTHRRNPKEHSKPNEFLSHNSDLNFVISLEEMHQHDTLFSLVSVLLDMWSNWLIWLKVYWYIIENKTSKN